MRWIWTGAMFAIFAALIALAADSACAAETPQLATSQLQRALEKHSSDRRYVLDARLAPDAQAQRSNRFSLRTELAPKATTAVCGSGDGLFMNGFETP